MAFLSEFPDEYGWQPDGTLSPEHYDDGDWHGRYDSKEGQTVSVQDAQALIEALWSAINDKAYEHRVENTYLSLQSDLREFSSERSKPEYNPWKTLKKLKAFILFAEGNEFRLM